MLHRTYDTPISKVWWLWSRQCSDKILCLKYLFLTWSLFVLAVGMFCQDSLSGQTVWVWMCIVC